MEGQHESKISKDENNAYSDLNHNKQSGREISSESNEEINYPSSEKLVIREHKFYIHGAWLALQSSYFRSLFFSGMKESNAKEIHVQIATNEEQAHLMLLEAMYKIDTLDKVGVNELLKVLKLAHKYDVKFVFKKCKYCLQAAVNSLEICEQIMHFIKIDNTITDVEDLVSTLQSFLAKTFSPLDTTWQTTSFIKLCEPSLKYLLTSNELVAASENTVFHALMYWIKKHGIENVLESQKPPPLLSVVRFELISVDYLYNIAQHDPVAKKLPDFNDHYLRGLSYHALSDAMMQRLPCQPVKRKATREFFIPYTWEIPAEKLDALVGTENKLTSDKFWFCGYKMCLSIAHVAKVKSNYNRSKTNKTTYKAKFTLVILNLTQQSAVTIQWQPASLSFILDTLIYHRTHAFNMEACQSSVDIKYHEIKIQQNTSSDTDSEVYEEMSDEPDEYESISVATTEFSAHVSSLLAGKPVVISSPQKTQNAPALHVDVKMKLA